MSVLMILKASGDPAKMEEWANANSELMQKILGHAREHGVIHHRFYGGDGEIVVVDEWESEDGFREFFDHEEDIPKMMQTIGAGEPQISFYRPLNTNDEI